MEKMTLANFLKRISTGHIFSVHFVRRKPKDGETERTMLCRTGVKKYLAGGELGYDPMEKKLLPVYDLEKEDYRCFPLDSVVWLRYNQKTWKWSDQEGAFVAQT